MSSSLSSSRPSVSSRVDSNSVQSQFASLTRSRDALRQELHKMEADRRRREREMRNLQQQQVQLSSQAQVLHESLGKHRMKRALLVKEKGRLATLLAKERQQLESIGRDMQEIATASTESKQAFCKDLQHVSESMEDLLQKHEDKHWCALLVSNQSNDGSNSSTASTSTNSSSSSSSTMEVLDKFIESRTGIGHAMMHRDEWLAANSKVAEYQELYADMMTEVEALREKARQVEPDTDLAILKRSWLQGNHKSEEMNLFYGCDEVTASQ